MFVVHWASDVPPMSMCPDFAGLGRRRWRIAAQRGGSGVGECSSFLGTITGTRPAKEKLNEF